MENIENRPEIWEIRKEQAIRRLVECVQRLEEIYNKDQLEFDYDELR